MLFPPIAKPMGLDVGEPFAGYSENVGLLPLPASVLDKARQWCRALQRQIWSTWWAAVETDTYLAPTGEIQREAEAVMVETALAVASIQVLYEIFLGAYPRRPGGTRVTSAYEVHCDADPCGQVVSGLKLIRNGEMHADTIVVPDVQRVVGLTFDDGTAGYRVFPHWASYVELPSGVRDARFDPPRNRPPGTLGPLKTNQIHHDHYSNSVGGHPVIETLLDALAFFARCDPRIVRLSGDGSPRHFPLEPINERDYERRHPDWPHRAQVELELREDCESHPPGGSRRILIAHSQDPTGAPVVHYGYTDAGAGRLALFAEAPAQILRDVTEFGYPYWMEGDGVAWPLVLHEGQLVADPSVSEESHLRTDEMPPWEHLWVLSASDAFAYRDQRRP